ncbi:MAG: M15 family metallopeptidase [Lachnospiraceae bacterium]|nr:M15 family metallopeptidase [Lachnospiraceae bacterium]
MKSRGITYTVLMLVLGLLFCAQPVKAATFFDVTGKCRNGQQVELSIGVNDYPKRLAGFDIYRADTGDGNYQYIGSIDLSDDAYSMGSGYWYDDGSDVRYSYIDSSGLALYHTYIYQIKAYKLERDKVYLETGEVSVTILEDGPVITYGKRNGKLGLKLKWTRVDGAEGYLIYCVKNYDEKSNYISVDLTDESKYELVETINGAETVSYSVSGLMNGVTYTYLVYSYRMMNGEMVTSIPSDSKSVVMNYYSYDGENYTQRTKRAFGSEKAKKKNFKTSSKASRQMKTIKIKVWDFKNGKNGKKVTRTKWLTVNKKMAPSIKQMFDELYKSKEKQVIHDIGCYSYRQGEHMYGLAIDINANENYMIDGKKILAGQFWKPKKNAYSIPKKCEFVRIMSRYGFYRGEWGARKDYMHFSYFGT